MEEKDFEPAGLIPRSIIRTVERFRQQLRPETIALGIQEFRISRYQVRVSVRYFFILLLLPITINWAAKNVIIKPLVGYFWNTYGTSLFLNSYQAERAFKEMRDFESQLFFEMLLSNPHSCPEVNTNFKQEEGALHNTWTKENGQRPGEPKASLIKSSLKKTEIWRVDANFSRTKGNGQKLYQQDKSIALLALQPSTSTYQQFILLPLNKSTKQSELNKQNKQSLLQKASSCISTSRAKPIKLCNATNPKIFKKNNLNVTRSLKNKRSTLVTPTTLEFNKERSSYDYRFISTEPYNPNFNDRIDISNCFEVLFQEKTYLLAEIYNQQSITALSNMFGDCIMIISIILLLRFNAPQFTILKSFLIESFYSFNDAIKCFYIILITDFLVGFHSPRGWEIVMEILLRHLGLPENEEFILLFVGTFPVFLDTAFKYWIFRYLNKISPSTVATYHSMIE